MREPILESYVVGEITKSFYNDGATLLPLHYCRNKDKNEIDIIIENFGTFYPVEVKTTSDPSANLSKSFSMLDKIPREKIADGVVVCMVKDVSALSKKRRRDTTQHYIIVLFVALPRQRLYIRLTASHLPYTAFFPVNM